MNRFLKISLLTFPLLLIFIGSFAQTQPVGYLGIENGLSNNAVTSIYQDHYGFMWFGTYDGLNRYNGYEFKVFRNQLNDSTSLIHNRIVAITEDSAYNIWIGTKRGISIYNPVSSKFSALYYKEENSTGTASVKKKIDFTINDLKTDQAGNVYIATAGKGLLFCRKGSRIAIQLKVSNRDPKAGDTHIQSIKIDQQGRVWVFIQGWGLYLLHQKDNQLKLVNNSVGLGNVLETDNKGHLWLGCDRGLYSYDIKNNTFSFNNELTKGLTEGKKIVGLTMDKNQQLWIATDGSGVAILSLASEKINFLQPGDGNAKLKSAAVYAIYEDRDSRKWIGTLRGGINIINPHQQTFETIAHDPLNTNSLINNFVLSFCETSAGNLWIGTDGGGLSYWDKRKNKYSNYRHHPEDQHSLVNDNVTGILQDSENRIWISTYGGGICRYNPQSNDFERFDCYNGIYQYLNNNVWLLFEDSHKNLFAGTVNGAVYCLNRKNNKFEVYDNTLMNVISLAEDAKGNLWAGTFAGLIKVNPLDKKQLFIKTDYPVRAIHEDKMHQLWVGTEGGGLLKLNSKTGKFTAFTEKNGLSSNSVLNILEDHKGILWLSTFNGITSFNPNTHKAKDYYECDGLQSNQFNYNAALLSKSGQLLFGGIKGFTVFNPDSLQEHYAMPELLLTGLKVNNKPYEQESSNLKTAVYDLKEIELPYDKTMLSVDFLALDYAANDKISYAYELEGWDHDWNYTGKVRTANYSRLQEGKYTLKIKSTNAEGNWNPKERIIRITVLPPWFRTWWAYLLYALAGSGIVYVFLHYKARQSNLIYKVKIAHYQAEKEKEIQEKKLSFFTNVSHEFRSPLTLIINPVKELMDSGGKLIDPAQLNVVYRNAKRLLSLVDQLLLFTRAESAADELNLAELDLGLLCKEVFLCFTHQAKSKMVCYEFEGDEEHISIFGDREKIEIMLFNLISNALKFVGDGGYVKVSVSGLAGKAEVRVSNNGPKIPDEIGNRLFNKFYQVKKNESTLKSGFGIGLYLVKNFAERHLAGVSYYSTDAETSFIISFKKGKEHLPGLYISPNAEQPSSLFNELLADVENELHAPMETIVEEPTFASKQLAILIIDDNQQIRDYLKLLFREKFKLYEAENAEKGLALLKDNLPDLVICDVVMPGMSGVEFCSIIKKDKSLSHIPVILLTGTDTADIKMKGFAEGADDYMTKPFENDMLITRVNSILKRQQDLQQYFFNRITLKTDQSKISADHKEFLDRCIVIVEQKLMDNEFNISVLASALGMSHSSLYKHVKLISGQSVSSFIRYIRLRKAAELFIRTDHNVNEVAYQIGFSDVKYFREQFNKLFGVNPSEYIRKYRTTFNKSYHLNEKTVLPH